jgi:pimeloyl-ACP methyl ester carboxylesterase
LTVWTEGRVEAHDITIHYHRTGGAGKPPVLLLHGITDNGLCWTRVARALEDSYDLVMPDARGHGQSDGPAGGFSIDILAEDAAALIRALELQSSALYGHSMGAITAASLAARHPDLVRALVLEDPPFMDSPPAEETQNQAPAQPWQWLEEFKALPREEQIARATTMNPGWPEDEIVPWAESKAQFDVRVLDSRQIFPRYPWRDVLSRIDCPILLITGDPERGAIIPPQIAEECQRRWKIGEVVHLEGAGHSVHRDRFDETMAVVRRFLAQR